jgi:hypothetical protein
MEIKVMDFIDIVSQKVKETKLYTHCVVEDVINWELKSNKKGNLIVKNIMNKNLNHSYKEATVIYFHHLDNECVYIGSTIDLFNRMGCISSAGSFSPKGEAKIPVSNGGKNKDTLVKFHKFLSSGKKLKTYAVAFYHIQDIKNDGSLDSIPLTPLKEAVEYWFIDLFNNIYNRKPLLSEGLDQNIAYGI